MPKYSQTSTPTREQVKSSRNPAQLEVVARPVSTYVAPEVDYGTQQLVDSLKGLNPALESLQQQQMLEQFQQDEQAAQLASATGKPDGLNNNAHDLYMVLDGNKRGDEDAAALKQEYLTFDKDTGDFDSWAQQKVAERTQGINDPAFLKGYLPNLQKAVGELKADFHKYQNIRVQENQQGNALTYIQQVFRDAADNGKPVDQATLQLRKQDLKDFYGMSYGDQNDLLLKAADEVANEGFYSVVDVFKQPNPDGTPGLYNVPKYRPIIEAMEYKAKQRYVALSKEAEALHEKELKAKQDDLVWPAFDMALNGDPEEAKVAMTLVLTKNRQIFSSDDIVKWTNSLRGIANTEESLEQKDTAITLLDRIVTGKADNRDIMAAAKDRRITYQQATQLTNEWQSYLNEQRRLAREDAADARAEARAKRQEARETNIFTTPEYKAADAYINDALPVSTRPGVPGLKPKDKADAKWEFRQRALHEPNRDPATLQRLAEEVVKRRTELKGNTYYKSFAEIQDDLKSRRITPGDAAFHTNLLKQQLGMNR